MGRVRGYNSYDTGRPELAGGLASGSTSAYEFSTFLETGYDFHFGNFTVGPISSLQFTACARVHGMMRPATRQSNGMLMAARCCLTVGVAIWPSISLAMAATWKRCTSSS